MTAKLYTRAYFNEEMVNFRKIMGLRHNWENDGHEDLPVDRAFKGLTQVYFQCSAFKVQPETTPEDIEAMESAFQALTYELGMRRAMMMRYALV
jgi:hypothetical protein